MVRASGRRVFLFLSSMHRQCNFYLPLLFFVSACASQDTSVGLNSERIRQNFGSYGVDVLSNENKRRISSLYSIDGDEKTTRTYAVVDFIDGKTVALARETGTVRTLLYHYISSLSFTYLLLFYNFGKSRQSSLGDSSFT